MVGKVIQILTASHCVILCRQAEFDTDRDRRTRRENEMIKQLTEHEQLVDKQYEDQIVSCMMYHNFFTFGSIIVSKEGALV